MAHIYTIILLFNIFYYNYYVSCEPRCSDMTTCGECVGYAFDTCVWCSSKNYTQRRCRQKSYQEKDPEWCGETAYDPQMELTVIRNDTFSTGKNGKGVVQFQPQHVRIKVRPGVPVDVPLAFKPAKDYPLDVYYLIDFTWTMTHYLKEIKQQGLRIYQNLTKLTNNVRLGVGSFIEKPAMPFVNPTDQVVYSFKNNLMLTDNVDAFMKAVSNMRPGINLDNPEAGFDALMQAMVCKKKIGWRENAYRIIVFSTDDTYHSAGDGKFVGTYRPNDMKCHLSEDGIYNESLIYDYPSVSQINKVAMENNIKIIFAIANKDIQKHYRLLEDVIQGAKCVELNSESNVVEMIEKDYKELISSITLDYNLTSSTRLKLEPDCSKSDICKLRHNEVLRINSTLTINQCPERNKFNINVGPISLDEKLEIEIEVDCECECEKPGRSEVNSTMCNTGGTYQCGVCKCDDNRYGEACQCSGTSMDSSYLDKCKASDKDIVYCNGRGDCRCRKCLCQEGFFGDFCQYSNVNCVRRGGKLCAGNGDCKYNKCVCYQGWEGESCSCPDHQRDCFAPLSTEVCSGRGVCECGECKCNKNNNTGDNCSGKFCDDCEEQTGKRCLELEEYTYCNFKENKTYCDEKTNITGMHVELLNRTQMNSGTAGKWCRKELDDNTILVFKYIGATKILIQNELDLPQRANIWVAVASAVGSVLLIGLITVIVWKYLIDMYDAKEYKKFVDESAAAGYDTTMNPLYQTPASDFTNPAYRGNLN